MIYTYFVQAGAAGPIKIGCSVAPRKRLMVLQVYHYETLRLLGYVKHDEILENKLHCVSEGHRIRGEWFQPTSDLVALIRQIVGDTEPETVSIKRVKEYEDRSVPRALPVSDLSVALENDSSSNATERQILDAIRVGGNITKAARLLHCARRTLQKRMNDLGIPRGRAGRPTMPFGPRAQPAQPATVAAVPSKPVPPLADLRRRYARQIHGRYGDSGALSRRAIEEELATSKGRLGRAAYYLGVTDQDLRERMRLLGMLEEVPSST